MSDLAALKAAMAMTQIPALVRSARDASLPDGVVLLLEVSAGDEAATKDAALKLERPEQALREAAGFYVEQVLFAAEANSYRVLGASQDAPSGELRHNMALLMRWVHPDVAAMNGANAGIDRSVFANRITRAWEDLKTQERRAAYDRLLLAEGNQVRNGASAGASGHGIHQVDGQNIRRGSNRRKTAVRRPGSGRHKPKGLLSTLRLFLRGLR